MLPTKREKKKSIEPGTTQNRINEGTKIKGDISSTGLFRIDGHIEGNITTPAKVVVGKTGVVKGSLNCENADIEGKIVGVVEVSGTLTIRATGRIEGDVVAGKLAVEPGAVLNASCIMQDGKSSASLPTKQKSIESSKVNLFDRQQRVNKITAEQPTSN